MRDALIDEELLSLLKDGKMFISLIALNDLLAEALSEYQRWGQLKKACAYERKFEKFSM